MAYNQRYGSMGVLSYMLNSTSSSLHAGNRVNCHEISAMLSSLHYKNKGVKSDCSNCRGITLPSSAGKVPARLLLNKLVLSITKNHLPESQCDFRANRGATNMVFVLRQLQEKYRKKNKVLPATFVELIKAFDAVSRKGLWQILDQLGCPPIPNHDHPASERPTRTSPPEQQHIRAIPHQQRCEAGLCPSTNSLQYLFQHDTQAGHCRPRC
ncbi:uncharacterized protein LOC128248077 [Octopus bimaculoides]|uniref:uncharacterized protein LOC128248077 n=1 Tax=Octopus bimaculoides TaxID=37653 RepID=UPI0022DF3401|nr:uncharacterized protein LOC128248077 [Octopus bimaculoides]